MSLATRHILGMVAISFGALMTLIFLILILEPLSSVGVFSSDVQAAISSTGAGVTELIPIFGLIIAGAILVGGIGSVLK